MSLNAREISIVKGMLARGDKQQDIAAFFGVNGGRISEINTGQYEDAVGVAPAVEVGAGDGLSVGSGVGSAMGSALGAAV